MMSHAPQTWNGGYIKHLRVTVVHCCTFLSDYVLFKVDFEGFWYDEILKWFNAFLRLVDQPELKKSIELWKSDNEGYYF